MGIHQSLYAVGMFTGPWLSGILADRLGVQPMFVVTAGIFVALVYLFLYLCFRKTGERNKPAYS
jgi:predicted MFS family arabinose efflux permease